MAKARTTVSRPGPSWCFFAHGFSYAKLMPPREGLSTEELRNFTETISVMNGQPFLADFDIVAPVIKCSHQRLTQSVQKWAVAGGGERKLAISYFIQFC